LRDLEQRTAVIVIRGAGENFCVGGDFKEMERLRAEGTAATRELFTSFHQACATIAELSVPVIAAAHGFAVAGGFELLLAADIVLVSETAQLADIHSNYGMVPGGGSTQRLPRLVGRQRALGLILSGERISGRQAVEWGLAYRAFGAETFTADVELFANTLAGKDRQALARSKRLVRSGLELPLTEGIALELATVLEHLAGDAVYSKGTS
jgi:enoyl-CoA hydratase